MKINRLTFNSTTNISIPFGIYDVLYKDSFYFGHSKNGKPNINGFLNYLIPQLSDYQDDLYKKILDYNKGNEEISKIVQQNIYNVYLDSFNFKNDGRTNISLRINKNNYEHFVLIHDVKLLYYNTDFTNYVRNLLNEYATKPLNHRETLYYYRDIKRLEIAIKKSQLCNFYLYGNDKPISFIPIVIEVSPVSRKNLIAGVTLNTNENMILDLAGIKSVIIDKITKQITDNDCEDVFHALQNLFNKETIECLG